MDVYKLKTNHSYCITLPLLSNMGAQDAKNFRVVFLNVIVLEVFTYTYKAHNEPESSSPGGIEWYKTYADNNIVRVCSWKEYECHLCLHSHANFTLWVNQSNPSWTYRHGKWLVKARRGEQEQGLFTFPII